MRAARTYADEAMGKGMNCAQAVLTYFLSAHKLTEAEAMRVAAGFGSGMRIGSICGAVTGAVMVLGLQYGMTEPSDRDARYRTNCKVEEFARRFAALHGTTACTELLGVDVTTEEGRAKALSEGLFVANCRGFVADAIDIAAELLDETEAATRSK